MAADSVFKRGQVVRHPNCSEWGSGEVLGQDGEKVRIFFEHAGEKKIDTKIVNLELVEGQSATPVPRSGVRAQPHVDMAKLEALCSQFHEDMKDNRPNSNDGKMGLNVLRDMQQMSDLSRTTRRQLLSWCHTEGSVYLRGVDQAQAICREVYGRVPTRAEMDSGA